LERGGPDVEEIKLQAVFLARSFFIFVSFFYCHVLIHFTLYSRVYCHLCDDMLHALQAFSNEYAFTVEVLDVDADTGLLEQFDELVPVLIGRKDGGEPEQLFHYFLNETKLRAFMRGC
jgi:hypothetical protein